MRIKKLSSRSSVKDKFRAINIQYVLLIKVYNITMIKHSISILIYIFNEMNQIKFATYCILASILEKKTPMLQMHFYFKHTLDKSQF